MMKKIITTLLAISLISCIKETELGTSNIERYLYKSINGITPEKIDGVSPQFYQPFYKYNFANGASEWKELSGQNNNDLFSIKVEDGLYKMFIDRKGSGDYIYINTVERQENQGLNFDDNFDVKINFKYINEYPNSEANEFGSDFGFVFGKVRNKNTYITCKLSIYNNFKTYVGYINRGNYNSFVFTKDSNVQTFENLRFEKESKKSAFNEILYRKIGKEFYIFLNGKFINYGEIDDEITISGGDFGFLLSKVNIAVKEIEIKKIIIK